MKRSVDPGKSGLGKRVGRREFLLAALASGGLAACYLRGEENLALPRWAATATAPGTASNDALNRLVTPNIDFFIRNHFEAPQIREESWSLKIDGLVSKPLKLSYDDLLVMPSTHSASTLECAGNPSGGRGVGTAVWSGLPLGELLKSAGLASGATTIVFHGADSGEGDTVPAGTHFARAIPIEKALEPSTLLVYEMNGEPLPAAHGFPLRALVPGWYGMDSVKWLTRVEVLDQPFKGYFQDEQYVAVKTNGERRPLTRMLVNSKFLRPSEGEEIQTKTYRIEGAAWAGDRKIAKVELRTTPGGNWEEASLAATPAALTWTSWSYDWHTPKPGPYTLEVRATDEDGHNQPEVRDPDRKDAYELNTSHRVSVSIR